MENFLIYDQLRQFPLFQGMSRTELLQMAGHTRFDFRHFPPRKVVVREGAACTGLLFLIKGEVQVTTQADDYSYRVVERLAAPWMAAPEVLMGQRPRHAQTVVALSECHFIFLSKDEIMRLVENLLTFRLNLLNLLSTMAQQRGRRQWQRAPQSLRERIARFFIDHSSYPAGPKEFHVLMAQLALYVNDSRFHVSAVLNQLQADGLISLRRGCIVVPSLERLFM